MPKKLKLDLINPGGLPFQLALKSAVFFILLFLVDYNLLVFLLFIFFAFYFYFRPRLNSGRFFYSFLTLVSVSLIIAGKLPVSSYRFLFVLFFGAVFFVLLGIKNLVFVHPQNFYYIINGLLLLSVFLSFFIADKSHWFILKYLLAGVAIFLLSREFLSFFSASTNKFLILLTSLVFAFLAMEMIWVVALLPMGFLNSSALVLLFMLVLEDFAVNYFAGGLNRVLVLRNVTIFVLMSLAIFAASHWSI